MATSQVSSNVSVLSGKLFKLLVLGDGFVGKTAITVRFCEDKFQKEYKMTIGVNFGVKKLHLRETDFNLQIWDIAGQQRFQFLRTRYYSGSFGVILVYDVTNRLTFQNLANWTSEFQEHVGNKPVVVVGNKIDLPTTGYIDPRTGKQYEKEVSYEEGKKFAKSINAEFFESSVKQNFNINSLFIVLIDMIEKKYVSHPINLSSYNTIEVGFEQLSTLINEGDGAKIFDGLLKLKQAIFKEIPYSVVLGNMNQWIEFIPHVKVNFEVKERLRRNRDSWKLYYKQGLQEGRAVTAKL